MTEIDDRRWLVELKVERSGTGWTAQGGLFDARGGWRKYGFGQQFGLGSHGPDGWSSPVEALTSAALSAVHMLGEAAERVAEQPGRHTSPGGALSGEARSDLPLAEPAAEMESDEQWARLQTNWPRIEELHDLLQRWEDEDAGRPARSRSTGSQTP